MNSMLEIESMEDGIEDNLLRYCKSGNYKQVVHIFDKFSESPGFDINCRDRDRNTPLILAVRRGHGSVVQELLRYMPDITLSNNKGQTAIDLATNAIMKLIFGCVSTCMQYSDRMFCNACWLGNIEVVERLIARERRSIPVNLANLDGVHCLLLPVINLSLLESAANQIKCAYKPAQVVQILLSHFTPIPLQCSTILHIVAKSNSKSSLEIARILLHRSIDVIESDEHGFTALHVAARSGNVAVLELLLTQSKNVTSRIIDVVSNLGCTPLHMAAMEGREECVKTLLRLGASKEIVNDNGHTPIQESKSVRIKNLFQSPEKPSRLFVLPEGSFLLSRSNTTVPRTPAYPHLHSGKKSAEPFLKAQENIFDFRETFKEPTEFYGQKEVNFPPKELLSVSCDDAILQVSAVKLPQIPFLRSRRKCSHSLSLECLKEEVIAEVPPCKQLANPLPSRDKLTNGKILRPNRATNKSVNKKFSVASQKPKKDLPKPLKSILTPSINKASNQNKGPKRKMAEKCTKENIVYNIPFEVEKLEILSDTEEIYESDFNTDNSSVHGETEVRVVDIESDEDELTNTLNNSNSSGMSNHINWRKGEQLGKGSYGIVWKGMLEDGQYIAVKEILVTEDDELSELCTNNSIEIKREIDILQNLRHKNIVKYLGACDSDTCIHIFMEFVAGGSISYILSKFGGFSENIVRRYSRQMGEALAFLNVNGVIHRDIKGANVMVSPKGIVKLIDFGCAKRMQNFSSISNSVQQQSRLHGSVYWMAPEVINGNGHSHKSDVWSLGCTVVEMFTTRPPWADLHPFAAMFAIGSGSKSPPSMKGFLTSDGGTLSDDASDFVNLCLTRDRINRLNAADLLQSAFLK